VRVSAPIRILGQRLRMFWVTPGSPETQPCNTTNRLPEFVQLSEALADTRSTSHVGRSRFGERWGLIRVPGRPIDLQG